MNDRCPGEHRFFVATTGTSYGKVWAVIVCTQCGEAQLKEFPVDPLDLNQLPVFFDKASGQLVTQQK